MYTYAPIGCISTNIWRREPGFGVSAVIVIHIIMDTLQILACLLTFLPTPTTRPLFTASFSVCRKAVHILCSAIHVFPEIAFASLHVLWIHAPPWTFAEGLANEVFFYVSVVRCP
jgi:hypothetical protein